MLINFLTQQNTYSKFAKKTIQSQAHITSKNISKKIIQNKYSKLGVCIGSILAVSMLINYKENKNLEQEVRDGIEQNIKDKNSEKGYTITSNEKNKMNDALKFYKANQHYYSTDNYFLADFVKESTEPTSDGGIDITSEEKKDFDETEKFLEQ